MTETDKRLMLLQNVFNTIRLPWALRSTSTLTYLIHKMAIILIIGSLLCILIIEKSSLVGGLINS